MNERPPLAMRRRQGLPALHDALIDEREAAAGDAAGSPPWPALTRRVSRLNRVFVAARPETWSHRVGYFRRERLLSAGAGLGARRLCCRRAHRRANLPTLGSAPRMGFAKHYGVQGRSRGARHGFGGARRRPPFCRRPDLGHRVACRVDGWAARLDPLPEGRRPSHCGADADDHRCTDRTRTKSL